MALNIKNADVERLARELAEATGQTLTDAVRAALEERLAVIRASEHRVGLTDFIRELQARIRALPALDDRSDDEILGYGPDGLPT